MAGWIDTGLIPAAVRDRPVVGRDRYGVGELVEQGPGAGLRFVPVKGRSIFTDPVYGEVNCNTYKGRGVVSDGIEPSSQASETCILSVVLRDRMHRTAGADAKVSDPPHFTNYIAGKAY